MFCHDDNNTVLFLAFVLQIFKYIIWNPFIDTSEFSWFLFMSPKYIYTVHIYVLCLLAGNEVPVMFLLSLLFQRKAISKL